MDQVKIKKMLQLLMLLSGSRKYSLAELAKKYDVDERTIQRYLATFKSVGFVINSNGGTYRLETETPEAGSLQKLLFFSEEEAYIILQTMALIEGETPVKDRLVCKLNTLYNFKVLAEMQQKSSVEIMQKLHQAIKEKKQTKLLAYRSSNSQTITDRTIEPFSFLEDFSAVWCYDAETHTSKQFKIARMQNIEILPNYWHFETKHVLPFIDVFRMAAPKPIATVTATLTLKACNLLTEEYPLAQQFVTPKGNQYTATIPVADYNGIGRFVVGLCEDVTVHGPEAFVDFLKNKINKICW